MLKQEQPFSKKRIKEFCLLATATFGLRKVTKTAMKIKDVTHHVKCLMARWADAEAELK